VPEHGDPPEQPQLSRLLGALADPARLAVLSSIASAGEAGRSLEDLVADFGSAGSVHKQVKRLLTVGLIERRGGTFVSCLDQLGAQSRASDELIGDDDRVPGVARGAFRDGRLVAIPRRGEARELALRYVSDRFAPGQTYSEREVNRLLLEVYDDPAALRRYLVDAGLLLRETNGARYWREPAG
jgi:hypothetical protein